MDKNFPKKCRFSPLENATAIYPKNVYDKNIKSKLSFYVFILENLSKFLNLPSFFPDFWYFFLDFWNIPVHK